MTGILQISRETVKCLILGSSLFATTDCIGGQGHTRSSQRSGSSYTLICHGVTSALTSQKLGGLPTVSTDNSVDKLRVTRNGQVLKVQVNPGTYEKADRNTKRILEEPDAYKITAETGEGFVAVFLNGTTTLHTLIIDRSQTAGIWTETGFTFFEPQGRPISQTVYLACTSEKQGTQR